MVADRAQERTKLEKYMESLNVSRIPDGQLSELEKTSTQNLGILTPRVNMKMFLYLLFWYKPIIQTQTFCLHCLNCFSGIRDTLFIWKTSYCKSNVPL